MIYRLAVAGYRSLRDVRLELGPLTVITGPNGSGKSSLYRALRLLSDVAQGRIIAALASEGGLSSTLWAGPETFSREMKAGARAVQGTVRHQPISLKLGFAAEDYGYAIDLGLPAPAKTSRFSQDPEIKAEAVWTGQVLDRANIVAERRGSATRLRDSSTGAWGKSYSGLSALDSIMTHRADGDDGLELLLLRDRMRTWRFYDDLRTDRNAPARRPQVGTYAPVLNADGSNIGAAVQTILEVGDATSLADAVADALNGATLSVGDRFEIELHQYGLLRPLAAAELSEGTLRYIMIAAALLSPRPPELMILNEPEASLHPDLLPPLARLMRAVVGRCQLIMVSHAPTLVDALAAQGGSLVELEKQLGETTIRGAVPIDWKWPSR